MAVWPVMAGCDPGPWPVILAVILVDPVLEGSRSDVQRAGEGVSWWPWPRPGLPGKVPNLGTWLFSRIFSKGEFFLRSKPYEVGPWLAPGAPWPVVSWAAAAAAGGDPGCDPGRSGGLVAADLGTSERVWCQLGLAAAVLGSLAVPWLALGRAGGVLVWLWAPEGSCGRLAGHGRV